MRIPSGVTDQYINFVAVDSTDFTTRETGLTTFTVYRSRNNGTATAMTTPTVAELSAANMPGVYTLLLDEDMTIGAGNDSEEMVFHITQASMAPVTRTIELYRPKITAGNTLDVTATGAAGIDWGNVENPSTANNLSGTNIDADQVVASVSGAVNSVNGMTSSDIGAIKAKTDYLPAATAGAAGGVFIAGTNAATSITTALTTNITGDVSGSVGSVLGNVLGNVNGSVGSNLELGPSEVNAEVADVLKTDTVGDPAQGAPPLSATIQSMVNYLYRELVRNKVVVDTNTANQKQVFADNDSTILYEKDLTNATNITTIAKSTTGA